MSVDRDIIENLQKRTANLESQIKAIRNNSTPTVPLYDPAQFPMDAIEGQLALGTDSSLYKFQDGTWTAVGGGGSGIEYEVAFQTGPWLDVETDHGQDSWSGYGQYFFDDGSNGSQGFSFGGSGSAGFDVNVDDAINLVATDILLQTTDEIQFVSDDYFEIVSGVAGVTNHPLALTGNAGIILQVVSGSLKPLLIDGNSADGDGNSVIVDIHLHAFEVRAGSSFPVLKILWNGTDFEYHMLSGSSWVADL